MKDKKIAIVAGARTPFMKSGTFFKDLPAVDIARIVIRELIDRVNLDEKKIDEVILSSVVPSVSEPNISRSATWRAGIPLKSTVLSVQQNCASSFDAITTAVRNIRAGKSRIIIAGGVENMSRAPIVFDDDFQNWRRKLSEASGIKKLLQYFKFKTKYLKPIDCLYDGTHDVLTGIPLVEIADKLAWKFGISRKEQDKYAKNSLLKHSKANNDGIFSDEIMTVHTGQDFRAYNKDEHNIKQIADSYFKNAEPTSNKKYGTVTSANSAHNADGGCFLLIMSLESAIAEGYRVLGILDDFAYVDLEPEQKGLGPVFATRKLLKNSELSISDFGYIEINESFASQVLACRKAFASKSFSGQNFGLDEALGEIPDEILNPNGGAISIGNPIGATGSRLILTTLLGMRRNNIERGLATACTVGGIGVATSLKLVEGNND